MIEVIPKETLDRIKLLSPRQFDVFEMHAQGLTLREMMEVPGKRCALKTLESHNAHLKERLGLHSNVELRKLAVEFAVHCRVNNIKLNVLHEHHRIETKYREFEEVGV